MLTLLGAVSAAPNATGRAVNASGRVLLTAAVSREAGTHNTMASYMDARAALELGDDTCETCTPSENAIDNCCSPGASWEGTCGDGLAHTWLAGYSACNGGAAELSPVTGAKVIREQMYANNQTEADLAPESRRILQMKREEHEDAEHERKASFFAAHPKKADDFFKAHPKLAEAKFAEEREARRGAAKDGNAEGHKQQHALLPRTASRLADRRDSASPASHRSSAPLVDTAVLQVPHSAPAALDAQSKDNRKAKGYSDRTLNVISRLSALINTCSKLLGDCSSVSDAVPSASCNVSDPSLKPCARLARAEELQRPTRVLSYGGAMGVEAEVLLAYYRRAAGCGAGCRRPPSVTCSDIDANALRSAGEAFASMPQKGLLEVRAVTELKRDAYDIVYCNFVLFRRMSATEYGDFVEQLLQLGKVVVVVSYVTDGWGPSKFRHEESLGAYQLSERAAPTAVFIDGNMFFAVHWHQGGLSITKEASLFSLPPREVCAGAASQPDWIEANTPCSRAHVDEWVERAEGGDFRLA
jgi:hypothetical protein